MDVSLFFPVILNCQKQLKMCLPKLNLAWWKQFSCIFVNYEIKQSNSTRSKNPISTGSNARRKPNLLNQIFVSGRFLVAFIKFLSHVPDPTYVPAVCYQTVNNIKFIHKKSLTRGESPPV